MPTERSAVASLADLMGRAAASAEWSGAAHRASVAPPVVALRDLEQVAVELTNSSISLARVGGLSIKIRVASYRALTERALTERALTERALTERAPKAASKEEAT